MEEKCRRKVISFYWEQISNMVLNCDAVKPFSLKSETRQGNHINMQSCIGRYKYARKKK